MESNPGFLDHFFAKKCLDKEDLYTEEAAASFAKLIQFSRQGHLCSKKEDLGEGSAVLLKLAAKGPLSPIVVDQDRFYLQKSWTYESLILKHIRRLKSSPSPPFFDRSILERELLQKNLLPAQAHAIRSALDSCLTLICGGPGTGKTYTASQLVHLLLASFQRTEKRRLRVSLSAPTGKAAAHLQSMFISQETSPIIHVETATLHRLLKLQPGENRLFSHRFIDADLIIVDEASMIDISLLAHLLEAVSESTLLVLMGDPDQLPPVDTGSLFGEMASSFGIFLEKSLRTEEAHLQDLASLIRRGDHQELLRIVTSDHPSFVHLPWKFDSDLSQKLYREIDPILSFEKPDPQKAIEKYQRCRILNALRQGPFGVDHLNNQIFHLLEQRKQKGQWWAIPILITVNDSRSQLYNGTSGVLIGQNLKDAVAYFPDDAGTGVRALSPPAYEMAFCLSIHKSQGSEFEEVLSLFPEGSENFGREALYTAATRSKKRLKIAGHLEVLQKMLSQHSRKRSGFSERIVCPPID